MINPATNCTSLAGTDSSNLKVIGPGMMAHNAATPVVPTATVGVGISPN